MRDWSSSWHLKTLCNGLPLWLVLLTFRLRSIYWRGHIFLDQTIHWNTIARENCFWCLLPWSNYLPWLFICIPYIVLSFGNCWQTIFQVSASHQSITKYFIIYSQKPAVISQVDILTKGRFLHSELIAWLLFWLISGAHFQFRVKKIPHIINQSISYNILFYIFPFSTRLDYCGIALLIMGSFVPWLYYGFYCHYEHKLVYLSVVLVLGMLSIIVSLYDKFSEPNLRPLRAGMTNIWINECHSYNFPLNIVLLDCHTGVFASFGLSGIIPAIHYGLMEGWFNKISQASLGWLVLMGKKDTICAHFPWRSQSHIFKHSLCSLTSCIQLGLLYILGAVFYALRVPERWFPGKFDLWVYFAYFYSNWAGIWFLFFFSFSPGTQFQSHQIFHVLVIAAAFVHYHGISEMAMYRVTVGECTIPHSAITFWDQDRCAAIQNVKNHLHTKYTHREIEMVLAKLKHNQISYYYYYLLYRE